MQTLDKNFKIYYKKKAMKLFDVNKTKINLTGAQISEIFTSISNQMLYNLNLYSTAYLEQNLLKVLSWVSNNRRKKISPINRDHQLRYLYNYIYFSDDLSVRFSILKKIKLDKFYIRKIVLTFINSSENYKELYNKYLFNTITLEERLKMSNIERSLGCSRNYLYPLLLNLEKYLELYRDITEIVMSKYYKFLYSLVKKRIYSSNRHFDEEELYQNYISSALKALDRYDPNKGALTSYIQLWIKHNQQAAEENPEYGIAYELPQLQLKSKFTNQDQDEGLSEGSLNEIDRPIKINTDENFSYSLESMLEDKGDSESPIDLIGFNKDEACPIKKKEQNDEGQLLLNLAKIADPKGIARLSLGITEFFDVHDYRSMVTNMKTQRLGNNKTVN